MVFTLKSKRKVEVVDYYCQGTEEGDGVVIEEAYYLDNDEEPVTEADLDEIAWDNEGDFYQARREQGIDAYDYYGDR
jgi:hypothetical protein